MSDGGTACNSTTYTSWESMVQRCTNVNSGSYFKYGAVGITVCDRWLVTRGGSFENFLEDMGERPKGKTLNRIHGAKVYSKDTCEWATPSMQGFDQKKRSTNTSGYTGVCWDKVNLKWKASIMVGRKNKSLGRYLYIKDAVVARKAAELLYFGFNKLERS